MLGYNSLHYCRSYVFLPILYLLSWHFSFHLAFSTYCKRAGQIKIDIFALSKTRLTGEGELNERGQDYTFFRVADDLRKDVRLEAGVGFAVKSALVSKLNGPPKGINNHLLTLTWDLPRL